MTHTQKDYAIADMRYAKSYGETALEQHYLIWRGATLVLFSEDAEYQAAIMEIYEKLDTAECLLKGA